MATCPQFDAQLTRLKYQTATGELQGVFHLQIGVYKFEFPTPLGQQTQYDLLNFMEQLDFRFLSDILLLTCYLYMEQIPFKLKYNWNKNCSIKYNITHLTMPRKIDRMVREQYQKPPPPWLQNDNINEREKPQWQNTAPNAETQCSTSQPT